MFTGPVGPVEVFFYWPEAVFGNFYWPGAIGLPLASSPAPGTVVRWSDADPPLVITLMPLIHFEFES